MEDNKIASLGYEELNKDIEVEIFGLKFGIGLDRVYLDKVKELQYVDGKESIEKCIDIILGKGSYQKIKEKYEKDQGKEIDDFIWTKVAVFLKEQFEKYARTYVPQNFRNYRPRNYSRRNYRKNYQSRNNYRRY